MKSRRFSRVGTALAALALLSPQVARAVPEMPSAEELQLEAAVVAGHQKRILQLIAEDEFDAALKEVQALEHERPNDAAIANLKGNVYFAMGDMANARKSFERASALKPDSIVAALNLAQLDLRDNKPDVARQRFTAILAKEPANAGAMVGLAGIERALGHDAEYVSWLEKATQADPAMVGPRILLARHYAQTRQFEKALSIAHDLRDNNPRNARVLAALADVQLAAGQGDEATATYSRMVSLFPNDADAHYKLATRLLASNSASLARNELVKAVGLRPGFIDATVLLASFDMSAGNYADALRLARDLQQRHPKAPAGVVLEGDVLLAKKDLNGAQTAYAKAWSMHHSAGTAMKLHAVRLAAGKPQAAEEIMTQWLTEAPGDVEARNYLADSYVATKEYGKAIAQYQQALQIDRDNVRALNNLAWTYQQTRDARALATAERAYQLAPANPEVADTLASILLEKGDTKRAVELLDRAADNAAASPAVRYHLAVALVKSGDPARARRQLERLLQGSPAFPQRAEAEALLKQTSN